MIDEPRTPIFRFVFVILWILFGGWVATHSGWGGIGAVIVGVAILVAVLFIVVAILREYRQLLYQETEYLEADAKRMEAVAKLSEEDKDFVRRDYRIGLVKRQEYERKKKHDLFK